MFHQYGRKESDILLNRDRVSSMEFDSVVYHRGQSPEDFNNQCTSDDMDEDHPMDEVHHHLCPASSTAVTPDRGECHLNDQRQQAASPSASSHHAEELQLSTAEHILALLQREAKDYSTPLPVKYYPTEFEEDTNNSMTKSSSGKSTKIGPWRKRIASWMYDVVDHFSYDRNIVSVSLRYIDQYVSYLLANSSRVGSQVVKRRHFQLIAVTSLYLAIKIHGELIEDDPTTGERVDTIESLLAEVDGFGLFKGAPKKSPCHGQDGDDEEESDDDLQALSNKIHDLRRKQRLGRLHLGFGFGSGSEAADAVAPPAPPAKPHSNIPYKNRRRGMLSGPLRLHSFVELSRGLFTAEDITDTERKILKALNYVVSVPTSRRFLGEMIRMMAATSCSASGGITLAEVGLDRYDFLSNVLTTACRQIEGASSVPALSIGCLPSQVAYAAVLNAFEDEIQKHMVVLGDSSQHSLTYSDNGRDRTTGSYQLEDFQRHYRRYSRSQSPSSPLFSIQKQLLEAWREQFLLAIFHGSSCFLTPDSEDTARIRGLLVDSSSLDSSSSAAAKEASEGSLATSISTTKKRSPRSPKSVIPRVSGNSFFSRHVSCSDIGASATPAPPPPPRSSSARIRINKEYFKQVSEPIPEMTRHNSHVSSARASTPDNFSAARLAAERELSNYESWRAAAFQPPPFFSA